MEKISYKDYINSLNKKDISTILETFSIPFKKSASKESLEILLMDNLSKIVGNVFNLFQDDELINIKLVVKKKGEINCRINFMLKNFLEHLTKYHLVIKDEDNYYMPSELTKEFSKIINNKKSLEIIKRNTEEYHLIMGIIAVYGVVDYDYFYNKFTEKFSYEKDVLLLKITSLFNFYEEFKIFKDKNKIYITSSVFKTVGSIKKYVNNLNYKDYAIKDILNIYTLKYMEKYRSYRKLKRYIERNYYVEKASFKIINKFVLIPFLEVYETNEKKALVTLEQLLNKYFEFKSKDEKDKKKFINLVMNMALDYPKWDLKGERKRNVKKES